MLRYALIFLVIALLASAFGMFGLSGVAMEAARILFWKQLVFWSMVVLVVVLFSFFLSPELRISDLGLVDVTKFEVVDLFVA